MKISSKIAVVLLLVLGMAPALTGCGGGTSASEETAVVETATLVIPFAVDGEWVRTSPTNPTVGEVYMNITPSADDALVGASVDMSVAEMTQLHETKTTGSDSAEMPEIASISMMAGKPLALVSGGVHIMLMNLKKPLEVNAFIVVTLKFSSGQTKEVEVPVRTEPPSMSTTDTTIPGNLGGKESEGRSVLIILMVILFVCGSGVLVLWLARSGILQSQKPIRSVDIGRSPRQLKPERLVPIGIIPDTFPEQKTPLKALLQDEVLTKKLPETIASTVITPPAPVRPTLSTSVNSNSKDAGDPLDERVPKRVIVSPKQIAEPSSFARHDWWDKDRDWCQISPLGMSNDVVCDIGTSGSLAVAAVSLRGHKHKVDSKACQDAFSLRVAASRSGEEFLIVVVCDGMSSAKYSHYGARRTSQLLAPCLAEIISDEESVSEQSIRSHLSNALDSCRRNLVPQSGDQYGAPDVPANGAVESDFYTTITFMILPNTKQAQGKVNVIVGSIGDSPVFRLREQTGEWEEVGGLGANSEIVNPATSAFPAVFDAQIQTVQMDEKDVIIVTSDGVGNFLNVRGSQTLLGSYLAEQWIRPVNLPTFINDVGFDLKSADDDRTVVAVWLNRG